jgi:hypothetical protein
LFRRSVHAEIDNRTPLPMELLFLIDEEGQPVLVPLVQATFEIVGDGLRLAEQQLPLLLAGEPHPPRELAPTDSPLEGSPPSWRLEPEGAYLKPAVDVVLLGHAYARNGHATSSDVVLTVGRLEKTVRAFGERVFVDTGTGIRVSAPRPFERLPLQWEYAFGGAETDGGRVVAFEHRNPVGRGFRSPKARFVEMFFLPNLENPGTLLTRWGQAVEPAGFGFVSGGWEPRQSLAGTFDAAWTEERSPLLPTDFDQRFFNAAPRDQVLRLEGNERVEVLGATPQGALRFALPELMPLRAGVRFNDRREDLPLKFDTVVIDADARQVRVLFRGHAVLTQGAFEVRAVTLEPPERGAFAEELRHRAPPTPHESAEQVEDEDEEEDDSDVDDPTPAPDEPG